MAATRRTRSGVLLVSTIALVAAACGTGDGADQIVAQQSVTTLGETDSTSPESPTPVEPDSSDPGRFGDFPFEASNGWLIGVDYEATSFESFNNELELDVDVAIRFLGRNQISISAGGCGIGGGGFDWVDGRVVDPELVSLAILCTPSDPLSYAAAESLIASDPEIRADDRRLLLLSDNYRLELEADGPGLAVLIEDSERFIAIETTVPELDPERMELASSAHFVFKLIVPVCEFHGAIVEEGETTVLQMAPSLGASDCEYAPASDKSARAFFQLGATVVRDGELITVENEQGIIQFRLATADDPPMIRETPDPPDRIIPPQPDRSEAAQGGKASTPRYEARAGTTEPGGVDIPAPEGWDVANPSLPSIHAAGRGTLDLYDVPGDQVPWTSENHPDGLELVDDPVDVTVKLYQEDGGFIVESGATATVTQYRYGSSSSKEWRRQVVWVLERGGRTTIAVVGFPEFPEGSGFDDPADSINLSLTGLDPIDMLSDIRFFE